MKDIQIGTAVVPFAGSTSTLAGEFFQMGWVLPGGERTLDSERAELVAANLDAIISSKVTVRRVVSIEDAA